jgi:hypothetical protein
MEMLSGSTTNLFLFWNESKHKFADDLRGLAKTKFNIVDFQKRTWCPTLSPPDLSP